ncbi:MAG TPA: hypothetical protein VGM88_09755 [Kofleriaceae bacterium]|jgi:hypothetical protein
MRITLIIVFVAACSTNLTPQPTLDGALPSCVPNRDGTITADELPVVLGATLPYYAESNQTIDQTLHDGVWDLSLERADDMTVHVGPVALGSQWYAAEFPSGQFVVDAGSGIDGIYHQDAQALWLDGTASQAMSPKTFVRYTDPVAVLRFPIAAGDAYHTDAQIPDGIVSDLPFIGSDAVDVAVTASGQLDVPYVHFSPVLEVQEHIVRAPTSGSPTVGTRTTLFLFECFGEIARAESKTDEPDADFTQAAYLRRYALGE